MREYEVVGVLDAEVAAAMDDDGDAQTIAVEHEDPDQRLVARPKRGESA